MRAVLFGLSFCFTIISFLKSRTKFGSSSPLASRSCKPVFVRLTSGPRNCSPVRRPDSWTASGEILGITPFTSQRVLSNETRQQGFDRPLRHADPDRREHALFQSPAGSLPDVFQQDGTDTGRRRRARLTWAALSRKITDSVPFVRLGKILREATGQRIDEWVRERLFEPIGITDFYWKITPDGEADTEGGLYLAAPTSFTALDAPIPGRSSPWRPGEQTCRDNPWSR